GEAPVKLAALVARIFPVRLMHPHGHTDRTRTPVPHRAYLSGIAHPALLLPSQGCPPFRTGAERNSLPGGKRHADAACNRVAARAQHAAHRNGMDVAWFGIDQEHRLLVSTGEAGWRPLPGWPRARESLGNLVGNGPDPRTAEATPAEAADVPNTTRPHPALLSGAEHGPDPRAGRAAARASAR